MDAFSKISAADRPASTVACNDGPPSSVRPAQEPELVAQRSSTTGSRGSWRRECRDPRSACGLAVRRCRRALRHRRDDPVDHDLCVLIGERRSAVAELDRERDRPASPVEGGAPSYTSNRRHRNNGAPPRRGSRRQLARQGPLRQDEREIAAHRGIARHVAKGTEPAAAASTGASPSTHTLDAAVDAEAGGDPRMDLADDAGGASADPHQRGTARMEGASRLGPSCQSSIPRSPKRLEDALRIQHIEGSAVAVPLLADRTGSANPALRCSTNGSPSRKVVPPRTAPRCVTPRATLRAAAWSGPASGACEGILPRPEAGRHLTASASPNRSRSAWRRTAPFGLAEARPGERVLPRRGKRGAAGTPRACGALGKRCPAVVALDPHRPPRSDPPRVEVVCGTRNPRRPLGVVARCTKSACRTPRRRGGGHRVAEQAHGSRGTHRDPSPHGGPPRLGELAAPKRPSTQLGAAPRAAPRSDPRVGPTLEPMQASECRSRRRADQEHPAAHEVRGSRATRRVVEGETSSWPPRMPASATGRFASQMSKSAVLELPSTSSSVTSRSASAAGGPRSRSPPPGRSNAVKGSPARASRSSSRRRRRPRAACRMPRAGARP